jgi:hypothetical protein
MPVGTEAEPLPLEDTDGGYIKPQINIKEVESNKDLIEFANCRENYLSDAKEIYDYFNDVNTLSANELVFSADCQVRIVHEITKQALLFLENKEIFSPAKIFELKMLIGEVVRDTLHSAEQGFDRPWFKARLSHLNDPEKFTIEMINPDKILCNNWPRFSSKESFRNIMDGKVQDGGCTTGMGATILDCYVDSLGGKAWYSDIKNAKGEKAYTFFHFEMSPEKQL